MLTNVDVAYDVTLVCPFVCPSVTLCGMVFTNVDVTYYVTLVRPSVCPSFTLCGMVLTNVDVTYGVTRVRTSVCTPSKLRGMVLYTNLEVSLDVFPFYTLKINVYNSRCTPI